MGSKLTVTVIRSVFSMIRKNNVRIPCQQYSFLIEAFVAPSSTKQPWIQPWVHAAPAAARMAPSEGGPNLEPRHEIVHHPAAAPRRSKWAIAARQAKAAGAALFYIYFLYTFHIWPKSL
jgi:hypothetical protein